MKARSEDEVGFIKASERDVRRGEAISHTAPEPGPSRSFHINEHTADRSPTRRRRTECEMLPYPIRGHLEIWTGCNEIRRQAGKRRIGSERCRENPTQGDRVCSTESPGSLTKSSGRESF